MLACRLCREWLWSQLFWDVLLHLARIRGGGEGESKSNQCQSIQCYKVQVRSQACDGNGRANLLFPDRMSHCRGSCAHLIELLWRFWLGWLLVVSLLGVAERLWREEFCWILWFVGLLVLRLAMKTGLLGKCWLLVVWLVWLLVVCEARMLWECRLLVNR